MTLLLIVLPAGLAVAAAALCWRNQRRWQHIRARPVMTCQQVAGLPPGQFVVLTGRTSDGPLMKSPYTGRECVGYRAKESWHRDLGQNDMEGGVDEKDRGLPIRVADGTGAVMVSEDLAKRRLSRQRDALLGQESMFDRTVKGFDGKTVYVYLDVIVPASAAVFVTGLTARDTSGGPMLTYGHWADGAATLPSADLDPRVTRWICATDCVDALMSQRCMTDDAERNAREAADSGDPEVMFALSVLLEKAGRRMRSYNGLSAPPGPAIPPPATSWACCRQPGAAAGLR